MTGSVDVPGDREVVAVAIGAVSRGGIAFIAMPKPAIIASPDLSRAVSATIGALVEVLVAVAIAGSGGNFPGASH